MSSPLIWLVAIAVMWFVARDALDGGLVFYVFGSTLLAMVVGVLLFALADRSTSDVSGGPTATRTRRTATPEPGCGQPSGRSSATCSQEDRNSRTLLRTDLGPALVTTPEQTVLD